MGIKSDFETSSLYSPCGHHTVKNGFQSPTPLRSRNTGCRWDAQPNSVRIADPRIFDTKYVFLIYIVFSETLCASALGCALQPPTKVASGYTARSTTHCSLCVAIAFPGVYKKRKSSMDSSAGLTHSIDSPRCRLP